MKLVCGATFALILSPSLAAADTDVIEALYHCERGVDVPAAYVNADDASLAIIHVEGNQVVLWQEISADGARYGTGGASGYVWWSKGNGAFLYWKAATGAEEDLHPLLLECKAETIASRAASDMRDGPADSPGHE